MKTKLILHYLQNLKWSVIRPATAGFLLILALSPEPCALSQIPQGFNYQAIARDGSGNPIITATMQVKIGILSDTIANTMVWEELFNPVRTNAFGMFNIVVGTGVKQSGSVATFSAIDWTKTPLFLRTSIYYPSSWKIMGTTKLQSVPYSMVAGSLEGMVPLLSIKGNTTTMDSALFVVRNNIGQIVFAVYNEGVRIYVDDGVAKGATKGGFAIGSFDKSKGTAQPLFVVDPDSIRGYIGTNTDKGIKGGFAIGGFSTNKAPGEEYLRVTRDSTRVNINEASKGTKGGFAIGGFNNTKGSVAPFTSLTSENYFIGHESGESLTSGLFNSTMGYQSGKNITEGESNVFMGYQSGLENTIGKFNVFLGYEAGLKNTSGEENVAVGSYAGGWLTAGGASGDEAKYNTCIGFKAGELIYKGSNNVMIGVEAGKGDTSSVYPSGRNNIMIGNQSGFKSTNADNNVFMGNQAGYNNKSGEDNIFVGNSAGFLSTNSYNVFIGYWAGKENTTGFENTFIGDGTGSQNGSGNNNVFVGAESGSLNTGGLDPLGNNNTFLGSAAGLNNMTGYNNVYMGYKAGRGDGATGYNNVSIGTNSGQAITTGSENTYIGNQCGYSNMTGSNNVFLGTRTGFGNRGSGNIFIGNEAGEWEEEGSNKLYIDNSSTSSPLIYGDFTDGSETLIFNGNVGIGVSPGYKLQVGSAGDGSQARANAWNLLSDANLKTGFIRPEDPMQMLSEINGYYFYWKTGSDKTKQFGFSAQEVEKILPEIVSKGEDGFLSLDYGKISPLLVEAIKKQQEQIESQQKEIDELKSLVNSLVTNQNGQGNK